jgi:hypothetical protein
MLYSLDGLVSLSRQGSREFALQSAKILEDVPNRQAARWYMDVAMPSWHVAGKIVSYFS